MYKRNKTRIIKVGNITIGGNNNVIIQSMTNTKTKDINKTVYQIKQLEKLGCQIIRVACFDIEDAKAIKEIKKRINIPIVADIHYDYRIALEAINNDVDKIRINPGNIGKIDKIKIIVNACKNKNIPIRIGINSGSLEKDIKEKYGITAKAMIESAKRNIKILNDLDFYDICLSLKSSNIDLSIEAYKMASNIFDYPLHIGITEAGTLLSGTVKSTIGLSTILNLGIGNTIRVSLTDSPKKEIEVAKLILNNCNLISLPTIISCPTCGRTRINLIKYAKEMEKKLVLINKPIKIAIMGCSVNGIGEAGNADYGIAGGINEVVIFKKGKIIKKVEEKYTISELMKIIQKD